MAFSGSKSKPNLARVLTQKLRLANSQRSAGSSLIPAFVRSTGPSAAICAAQSSARSSAAQA